MANIDTIARANLAQTKTQIHQMSSALRRSIGALDGALKSVERIYTALGDKGLLEATVIKDEIKALRQARGEFTAMSLYLRD